MKFYSVIASDWIKRLKKDGHICVEVGQWQAQDVKDIFADVSLRDITTKLDLNGIDRVVQAKNEVPKEI